MLCQNQRISEKSVGGNLNRFPWDEQMDASVAFIHLVGVYNNEIYAVIGTFQQQDLPSSFLLKNWWVFHP